MKYHVEFDIDFRRNPYKGLYVALEGIDGSGKTTQVQNLENYIKKAGRSVFTTSEPRSDSIIGTMIRQVLQSELHLPAPALQYLYSADRTVNQETVVKPGLERGSMVISHRSFWSVIPYGIMDKGLADYTSKNSQVIAVAQGLLSMYHQFLLPDVTFYLNVPVDISMKRLSKMRKVYEIYETREKLEKIAEGYQWQIKQFPNEFVIIDGAQDEKAITEELIRRIKKLKR